MRYYLLVVTRPAAPSAPILVEAWQEATVDADPAGWSEVARREVAGGEVHSIGQVLIEVADEEVLPALRPPQVTVRAVVTHPR